MAIDANIIRIDFRCVIKSVKVPNTTTLIMSFSSNPKATEILNDFRKIEAIG